MNPLLRAALEAVNAAVDAMERAYEALTSSQTELRSASADAPNRDALERGVTDALATFDAAEAEVQRTQAERERVERLIAARTLTGELPSDTPAGRAEGERISVGAEAHTYRPDGSHSFFRDLWMAGPYGDDRGARERLNRHAQETAEFRDPATDAALAREQRDITTGDPGAGGYVPPVYLAEMAVDFPRGGRRFADICMSLPLPADGLVLTIPKVQSGTAIAAQASQGTAVQETDADSETITSNVRTYAGQNDLSIQAVERTLPSFDSIVMRDLVRAYDEKIDTDIIGADGTSGTHLGIRSVSGIGAVTYTDASPTAAEALPKLFDAIQRIESGKVGEATHVVWHPRRGAWFASNLSASFPLFQLGNLVQAVGTQAKGQAVNFAGVDVVRDVNIVTTRGAATNEDEIAVVNADQLYLAEGELRTRALPEVLSGTLQVRLQVFAYSAFIPHRLPAAISQISGTGLAAPTFA